MKISSLCLITVATSALLLSGCNNKEENGDATVADKKEMQSNAESAKPKVLEAEPVKQSAAIESSKTQSVTLTGSIIYKELEGGFYAFIAENGDRYTLHGLDETYQKNGLIVEVNGVTKPDVMTFTQFGTVLQVNTIKVLDTSKVIDNIQTQ